MDTTQVTNLWPADLTLEVVRTPLAILKEQATLLAKLTKGLVFAEVKSHTDTGSVQHSFRLVVPTMGDYRFELFGVRHGVGLYPVFVSMPNGNDWIQCANEEEFQDALRTVLSVEETRRILQSLVSQATEASST